MRVSEAGVGGRGKVRAEVRRGSGRGKDQEQASTEAEVEAGVGVKSGTRMEGKVRGTSQLMLGQG